jgi:LysM repeat protein
MLSPSPASPSPLLSVASSTQSHSTPAEHHGAGTRRLAEARAQPQMCTRQPAEARAQPQTEMQTQTLTTQTGPSRGERVHRVEASDTLAGLALQYGVSVQQIREANRLACSSVVQVTFPLSYRYLSVILPLPFRYHTVSYEAETLHFRKMSPRSSSFILPRQRTSAGPACMCVCVYVCVYVCMCVCSCVHAPATHTDARDYLTHIDRCRDPSKADK